MAHRLPTWSRNRDRILSALMWILYLYLIRNAFLDLYILGEDAFDWTVLGLPSPDRPAIIGFLYTIAIYLTVVVINGSVLIGWALYNKIRFGGRDKRAAMKAVSADDLAKTYGFPAETITAWQNSRAMVMRHDPDGRLLTVTPKFDELRTAP